MNILSNMTIASRFRQLRTTCQICGGKRHREDNVSPNGEGYVTYWCDTGCEMESIVANKIGWTDSEFVPLSLAYVWTKVTAKEAKALFALCKVYTIHGVPCFRKIDLINKMREQIRPGQ